MARKQVAVAKENPKSTKSVKTGNRGNKTSKRSRTGAPKQLEEDDEPEVQISPDSSFDSEPLEEEEEDADVVAAEEGHENYHDEDAEGGVENVEEGESNNTKKNKGKSKKNKKNKNKHSQENGNVMETTSLWRFPMHRVIRIIKREDPNVRISQEAVYLINKASEKFLQLFSMEAYACAFLDRKKTVAYKHLYFVPERLKAEDALREMPSVEMS